MRFSLPLARFLFSCFLRNRVLVKCTLTVIGNTQSPLNAPMYPVLSISLKTILREKGLLFNEFCIPLHPFHKQIFLLVVAFVTLITGSRFRFRGGSSLTLVYARGIAERSAQKLVLPRVIFCAKTHSNLNFQLHRYRERVWLLVKIIHVRVLDRVSQARRRNFSVYHRASM